MTKLKHVANLANCSWFLFQAIDRWIHYDMLPVKFSYILVITIFEFFRVGSAVLFVWGTYEVVWRELQDRFREKHRGYWWFASKAAFFLVFLVSFYYAVLYLALSIVWLEFRSLNSIADIATKRTGFEISMAAFLTAFSLLTVAAAIATTRFKAKSVDGRFVGVSLIVAPCFIDRADVFVYRIEITYWQPPSCCSSAPCPSLSSYFSCTVAARRDRAS